MLPAVAALAVGGGLLYASHKLLVARRRMSGLGRPLHPSLGGVILVIPHPGPLPMLRDRVARRLRALPQVIEVEPVDMAGHPGLNFLLEDPADTPIAVRFSRRAGRPTIARLDLAGAEAGLWPLDRRLSAAVLRLVADVLPEHERLVLEPDALAT